MFKKKHVGRPTNEELKKRSYKKIAIASIPLLGILLVVTLIKSGSLSKLMGASVGGNTYQCEQGGTLQGSMCIVTTSARLLGDVNGDSFINENDAEMINGYLSGNNAEEMDKYALAAADVNGDSVVTSDDYSIMINTVNGNNVSTIGSTSSTNIMLDEKYVCPSDTVMEGTDCVYKYQATESVVYDSSVGAKKLGTPVLTSVKNVANGQKINWKSVSGAKKYRVYVYNNGWKRIGDTSGTSYVNKNLTIKSHGKSYKYTVKCIDSKGNALSDYNSKGISLPYYYAPVFSTILRSYNPPKTNYHELRWCKNDKIVKYRVYYKKNKNDGWKYLGETKGLKFRFNDFKDAKNMWYTIKGFDNNNVESAYDPTGWKIGVGTWGVAPSAKNSPVCYNSPAGPR